MQWENNEKAILGEKMNIVSEMKNGVNQITVDGRLIADGNKIFIPWNPQTAEKIYRWNQDSGETTWQLPESWKGENTVKVFRLSDKGRTALQELKVKDNQVTFRQMQKLHMLFIKEAAMQWLLI